MRSRSAPGPAGTRAREGARRARRPGAGRRDRTAKREVLRTRMHIRLIAVGRLREPYTAAAADDFRKRLRPYHRLEEIEVRSDDAILRHVDSADEVWLLERTGTQLSSHGLAQKLEALQARGRSRLTLVIGGAFGVPDELVGRANFRSERTGTQLSSHGLAQKLEALQARGRSRLTLVIGGAFGVPDELVGRANFLWSLSELTFLHEWARIIVLEQLYRAAKIARNEPYHH